MVNVLLMGTASAPGSAERDNTYMLLEHDESCWMVDVGGNPLGKLKQAGISLDRIQGILLTHFHVDHIYGLPSLLWGMWIAGRTEPLTVYCSSLHENQLREILRGYRVEEWPIRFRVEIQTFDWTRESELFVRGDLKVSVFPSLHVGATVGLQATYGTKRLIYSADTTPNPRIRELEHMDVLIHEATKARQMTPSHTSLEELLAFYPLERMGSVIVVHLSDGEPYEQVLQEQDEAVRSKVRLGRDMMRIAL